MTAAASARFEAIGVVNQVAVADAAALDDAVAIARAALEELDLACSRFRDDSELARVNAAAGASVEVGELLWDAVGVALRAAAATGGAVDPTVGGALVALGWDRDFAALGGDGDARVVRVPGWRSVRLDRARRRVRVPRGTSLDLGATAKALAADRIARAIRGRCGVAALVSLGGDVAVAGAPNEGWPVLVTDDHRSDGGDGQVVAVRGGGLATSSTTVRRWRRGGRELHHVIDPRTGEPAPERWRTVSVAAASCVDANTASTAAIVLGERAPSWLEAQRLPARLVRPDGSVVRVAGWPEAA